MCISLTPNCAIDQLIRKYFLAYFAKINIKFYINFLILNFRTGSSSSGDNLTDDSGIHSKSTSKDSPRLVTKSIINYDQPQKSIIKYDQPVQPVKIERVAIGRRPVRKLPAVPSSKQAHIVQLKSEHKKLRALPQLPTGMIFQEAT